MLRARARQYDNSDSIASTGVSLVALTTVWSKSQHKGNALLLLLAIADWANESGAAWGTLRTLSEKARVSEKAVRYLLLELERSGELVIQRAAGQVIPASRGRAEYRTDLYVVSEVRKTFPNFDDAEVGKNPVRSREKSGQRLGKIRSEVGKNTDAIRVKPNLTVLNPTEPKPLLSPISGESHDDGAPDPIDSGAGAFDAFWKAYPRKDGKQPARKAWACLNATSRPSVAAAIMAGLERAMNTRQWRDVIATDPEKRMIPHASTWLRQRRFEDEATAVAPQSRTQSVEYDERLDGLLAWAGISSHHQALIFKGVQLTETETTMTLHVPMAEMLQMIARTYLEDISRIARERYNKNVELDGAK